MNKKTFYAHLHKGKEYKGEDGKGGRGYHLPEAWLKQGAAFTKNWIWNEARDKQTKPFSWLIGHFWPVPTWPENWEEVLYIERPPRLIGTPAQQLEQVEARPESKVAKVVIPELLILSAIYGIDGHDLDGNLDVTERLQSLVVNNSLDIVVNNATLCSGQNPHRGKKKKLTVMYQYVGSETITVERDEKDWLIIGQVQRDIGSRETADLVANRDGRVKDVRPNTLDPREEYVKASDIALTTGQMERQYDQVIAARVTQEPMERASNAVVAAVSKLASTESKRMLNATAELNDLKEHARKAASWIQFDKLPLEKPPMSPTALNDYLIRKFSISPQRLRGPMPIELCDFHRDDLAALFAELGFKRGAEIGVAEGKYSEVLLKANPECELLLVDPWSAYEENPQNKSQGKHSFAEEETRRKVAQYPNVKIHVGVSMDVVRSVEFDYLDFCYIDGNHSFDFVMQDLIEWSKRVRSGGIISGDDYYALDQKRWVGGGVVEAVQAYTNAHRIPIWWIFSGHKSVDFFWVKP